MLVGEKVSLSEFLLVPSAVLGSDGGWMDNIGPPLGNSTLTGGLGEVSFRRVYNGFVCEMRERPRECLVVGAPLPASGGRDRSWRGID